MALLYRELMEAEVADLVGADRYERCEERVTFRNGYRSRQLNTRVGTLDLAIPKLRSGSYFPSFLEPRKRSEQALLSVVVEAYVNALTVDFDDFEHLERYQTHPEHQAIVAEVRDAYRDWVVLDYSIP